jgi:lipopolysaccharide exporter
MTDVTSNSVLAKTAKGAGWIIGWRMVTRILGLVSTLFLVRLLQPTDFGLVTLATSFGFAIDSLSSLGVEEAIIREKDPGRDLYDSAFTINVIRGLATTTILVTAAWPIAVFFKDMRLAPVMLALATGSLIGAFENIGIVDFRRNIAFQKEFLLMSVPRLVSIVVAIGTAFIFRSYWALIVAILTSSILRVAMGYAMHPLRPRFGLRSWRQIAGFSFWSWALSLSSLVRDRSDAFIIGRVLDITQVGIFSVAAEIASLPTTELVSPLARACFSSFASVRHADTASETANTFLRIMGTAILIVLPAGVGISLIADPIVKLAFGSRWLGATNLIQILGAALTVMIPGLISASVLNAHAVLRPMFRVQIFSVVVRVVLMVALVSRFGLIGAAIGVALGTATEHLLYLGMTLRRLRLGVADLLRHIWRSILATGVMAASMALLGLGWTEVPDTLAAVSNILMAVPLSVAIYAAASALLWIVVGRPVGAERDMWDMLRKVYERPMRLLLKQRTADIVSGE